MSNLSWLSACGMCLQATKDGNTICCNCAHLLKQLCAVGETDAVVFSHQWQAFHYLGHYESILASSINRGKFKADRAILAQLARMFANQLSQAHLVPEGAVIPVPMKYSRRLKRGFNQADVIAKTIAKALGLKCYTGLVRHSGKGHVQHHLSRKERMRNMRKAFLCTKQVPEIVYVVDDVFTTGATVSAMCDCLRANGARYIEVWVLAVTP